MNYERKIRKLKNEIKKLRAKCVGFSVLSDKSLVYAVNGNFKNESKILNKHGKDIEKILGSGTKHSNISYSFSYFIAFNRRDAVCKKYEDYFYKALDSFGWVNFYYFMYPKEWRHNPIINNRGNFNCVERKLIGYSNFDEMFVSLPPCYFCLAAMPSECRVNFIHYRNFRIGSFVRCGDTFYKIK